MKTKISEGKTKRRTFLRNIIAGGAGLLAMSIFKTKGSSKNNVKFLTPDGKLVEIDISKFENKMNSQRATNKEVMEWMQPKLNKSELYGKNS